MASNTNPFLQHAESMQHPPETPDLWNTKESYVFMGTGAHGALPSPNPGPATSSTDSKAPQSFPEHLPYRTPPPSPWTRVWRSRKYMAVGAFCFLVVVGGTIAGAFFLVNVMRTGLFHPGSGANMTNATRTVHVTVTTVVPGMGEGMVPVTETIWSMQETQLSTQWVKPKTTTVPVMPTRPATTG
ncbi:hypothetical protein G6011_05185 [Alternaria panax]|uniref:Uncharacterized protein n=1 Tax=Alternaria panax TaxID=48097 RepID=A0AAD4FBE6_9PLEO|nr:hypothetical protein G6011_05185 [Alternaria panax]